MNSLAMSRKASAVVPRAGARRTVAAGATRRPAAMAGMQVLRPEKKYECLSYLPPLSDEDIAKQVVYLVNQGWSPMVEFSSQELADTTQLFFAGPALYEGRYWTMWKLPLFGCSDPQEVITEIE